MSRIAKYAGAICLLALVSSIATAEDDKVRAELSDTRLAPSASSLHNPPSRTSVIDCIVDSEGQLTGRLVNAQGTPIKGTLLALAGQSKVVDQLKTDGAGEFRFTRVNAGTYVVNVNGRQVQPIRIWDRGVAPPNAKTSLLLVAGSVTRAQHCETGGPACGGCESCCETHPGFFGGAFQSILRNPWIVGAGTAAAIAIPLSTSDDDDDIGSSSIDSEEAS